MPLNAIRADIRARTAYPVADVSADVLKLDAMEAPYPFDDDLRRQLGETLAEVMINRYPAPAQLRQVRQQLRQTFNIPETAEIALGNGSDELIQLLVQLVAAPDAVVLAPEPSFVMYRHNAELYGMKYVGVPLNEDFGLDVEAMLAAIETHRPALIFIAHPNNPTGVPFSHGDIERIIQAATGLIVIDEAYGAFSDDSFIRQAGQPEHLIVLRTLSKLGFAGLRLGYAAAAPAVAGELAKITPPYNMNRLVLAAAGFALERFDIINRNVAALKLERAQYAETLAKLPETHVFPSQGNFIVVRLPDAQAAYQKLIDHNILVKKLHGSHPLLDNCLRLTVGSNDENNQVLRVLNLAVQEWRESRQPATTGSGGHTGKIIAAVIALIAIAAILWFVLAGAPA